MAKDGQGICRILHRGVFDAVMPTQSHDYQSQPDIELQQGNYSSGFAGNDYGLLVDLGEVDLRRVDVEPTKLSETQRATWRFLHEVEAARDDGGSFSLSAEDREAAAGMGLRRSVAAVVGHTYLLRSVHSEHDVLVAFTVLAGDDAGHTLLWRILSWHR